MHNSGVSRRGIERAHVFGSLKIESERSLTRRFRSPIGDGENARDGCRVNLGCVEGLDALALDISIIDGKALPVIEESG